MLHRVIMRCLTVACLAFAKPGLTQAPPAAPPSARDGQHDFDWAIGTWKTHVRRLRRPLTGSTEWVEMEGITRCRKVWDGRANLLELEAHGPSGRFSGLSLRLYHPESRQWWIHFSNAADGVLAQPTIGQFTNGRGEFYDQEPYNGRMILVRFVMIPVDANTYRYEQAFSDDGGKTWELNWIAVDTRTGP